MPVEAASPDGSISSACSVLPTLPVLTWAFRTFRPAGMLTWYQAVCPVLVARPLPPVRVPVNAVDGSGVGQGKCLRGPPSQRQRACRQAAEPLPRGRTRLELGGDRAATRGSRGGDQRRPVSRCRVGYLGIAVVAITLGDVVLGQVAVGGDEADADHPLQGDGHVQPGLAAGYVEADSAAVTVRRGQRHRLSGDWAVRRQSAAG